MNQPTVRPGPAETEVPAAVVNEIRDHLITYMLYERNQDTAVREELVRLVTERHHKFHDAATDFPGCKNENCQRAARILETSRTREITLTPLALEICHRYGYKCARGPHGLRVRLIERAVEAPQVVITG